MSPWVVEDRIVIQFHQTFIAHYSHSRILYSFWGILSYLFSQQFSCTYLLYWYMYCVNDTI